MLTHGLLLAGIHKILNTLLSVRCSWRLELSRMVTWLRWESLLASFELHRWLNWIHASLLMYKYWHYCSCRNWLHIVLQWRTLSCVAEVSKSAMLQLMLMHNTVIQMAGVVLLGQVQRVYRHCWLKLSWEDGAFACNTTSLTTGMRILFIYVCILTCKNTYIQLLSCACFRRWSGPSMTPDISFPRT